MRGIRYTIRNILLDLGITPAHAGNTLSSISWIAGYRDHPRACGEYVRSFAVRALGTGITPAHAGNTNIPRFYCFFKGDHPRACGEYTKKSHDIAVHLARNPNFYLVSKFTRMES